MIVAQQIVNGELKRIYFVFFVTYLAQVSRIALDIPKKTILDIRAALWPTQYAWGNVPSHDPNACGRRKAAPAPQ
jgi:hypothetical protein